MGKMYGEWVTNGKRVLGLKEGKKRIHGKREFRGRGKKKKGTRGILLPPFESRDRGEPRIWRLLRRRGM